LCLREPGRSARAPHRDPAFKGWEYSTLDDARGLRAFLKEYPEAEGAVLLHAGGEIRELGEKVIALPWWLIA